MHKIAVINGPNLNMLGTREPSIYGKETYKDLKTLIQNSAKEMNIKVKFLQSNHEGTIIDYIQQLKKFKYTGLIINPGALTHYSYAIRDAISAIELPAVEVHISDIETREEFRRHSVIKDVCVLQIKGLGLQGYIKALEHFNQNH